MSLGIAEIASHDGMPSSVPWDLSRGGIEQVESRRYWRHAKTAVSASSALWDLPHDGEQARALTGKKGEQACALTGQRHEQASALTRQRGEQACALTRKRQRRRSFKTGFSATEVQQDLVRRELV